MTRIAGSSLKADTGVAYVHMECAHARVIFREVTKNDVGVDAVIEFTEDGDATGVIAGVQIKSGDSFVSCNGNKFTFVSDQQHFGYWARFALPMIGVVYAPALNKAVWIDLTAAATQSRIANGPYSITVECSSATEFSRTSLGTTVARCIYGGSRQRLSLNDVRELIAPRDAALSPVALETGGNPSATWRQLLSVFSDANSTNEEIADAGYRLSWYFPTVDKELQDLARAEISALSKEVVAKIVAAVAYLIERDSPEGAELITDLIALSPRPIQLLEMLWRAQELGANKWAGAQMLDYLSRNLLCVEKQE